jgi:hypothetical protein
MILNVSSRYGMEAWPGSIWLRIGIDGGLCKCGNEPLDSTKCREFVDSHRTG